MRKTKEDLQRELESAQNHIERQAARILELQADLDNARLEIAWLRKQLEGHEGKTEQKTERFTVIPDRPKRGARRKADPETRQYIHELRKFGNSLQMIADQTGMSKTQCHAIIKEEEIPGKWYSETRNGKRTYYKDYAAAVQSEKNIHFEMEV